MNWLTVPTDKGANAGLKVASLVAGMVAGADSIDDMAVLRHGGMKRLFNACYAPSTLGSFLRSFTFGHVRQLDAVASRFLGNLAARAPLLGTVGAEDFVFVDVDDTIIEVHGYAKQGSGYGYSGVRGPERAAGHRLHEGHRPGDRRPAAAQGSGELGPRRQTPDHRCPGHAQTRPRPAGGCSAGSIRPSTAMPRWPRRWPAGRRSR